ncbi:CHAT domain-containing protein [Nocardia sp. 2YAB30]|uniref:CHAT domain-containing protein n=1 Tax=unclassified Nocardia TaxID=2637762 RepID=UPI003F958168
MTQPTVFVRMADAGDVYVSWRWVADSAPRGAGVLPEEAAMRAVGMLADALPRPADSGGLECALTTGAFANYENEYLVAQALSRALLPYGLAAQLYELFQRGVRPHIRLQPSPRVAQVPWELIAPDRDIRLIDIADVSLLAPAGIVQAPARVARRWSQTHAGPVVAVLDPRIPGFRADSTLGSVLGRMTAHTPLAQQMAGYAAAGRLRPATQDPVQLFRRTDLDRAWLGAALSDGASRLIYVGHVTAAVPECGRSEDAELHLACTADAVGFAVPTRTHRPLSAKDLLLGTHTLDPEPVAGPALWPIPSRVALIACESGGDLRFSEALGLTAAMINGGAELVTASRWALPTDLAFQRIAGAPPDAHPLQQAICAIDTAHEQPDPVTALAEWQRARLAAWRDEGRIEHSPVLWSAFATVCA